MNSTNHKRRTLWLVGVLHALTHIYHVALLPLYLLIQEDLRLGSVEQSTLLVTVLMVSYYLPSYLMGVLADSLSRKKLLGFGLALNALGFVGLSFARTYPEALVCVVVSGIGGSFFHPSATALIARMFPTGTGKALGLVGIGASVGFFIGPIYTGWRAGMTGSWRTPVLELGLAGLVVAWLFLRFAGDAGDHSREPARTAPVSGSLFPTPVLWMLFLAASVAFSFRDFAGSSMGSLSSLFLQKAHGYDIRQTGLALSGIFLASSISNPLFGRLSDGGRGRWTVFVVSIAAVMVALVPHVSKGAIIPVFAVYGFFFMASFPIVEATLMESVPDHVRGRVFGLFITIGGLIGNLAHWLAGSWVKALGAGAGSPANYYNLYALLSFFALLSLLGMPCLYAIRRRERAAQAATSSSLPIPR
jgi:MFS family permease